MRKLFYLIAIFMIIVSCEKTINMEIPNKGRKLVLNSVLNDTGFVSVSIHKSRFILDNSDFPIVNYATIVLWENNIIVDTLVETGNGIYTSKIIPKIDSKYYIEASSGDLKVSSETIMPKKTIAYIKDTLRISKENGNYLRVRLTIEDPGHIENYYAVYVNFTPIDTTDVNNYNFYIYFSTDENVFDNYYDSFALLSDKKFNGMNYTASLYFDEFMTSYLDGYLNIYILNLNKDLYWYYVSCSSQSSFSNSPFSEPVFVPNNIKDGYGIFSSMTIQKDTIKLSSTVKPPIELKKNKK